MADERRITGWRWIASVIGLSAMGLLQVLDIAAYALRFYALDSHRRGYGSDALSESSLVAVGCVSLLEIPTLVLTATVFIIWFHRIYTINARLPGKEAGHHTAWAIWGFIVPIVNILLPPLMAVEVAEKSSPPGAARRRLILCWWIAFAVGNLAGNIGGLLFTQGHPGAEQLGTLFGVAGGVLGVVAAFLAVRVVLYLESITAWAAGGTPRPDETAEA